MTALVLVVTSMRKSRERLQPASCGINYFRRIVDSPDGKTGGVPYKTPRVP